MYDQAAFHIAIINPFKLKKILSFRVRQQNELNKRAAAILHTSDAAHMRLWYRILFDSATLEDISHVSDRGLHSPLLVRVTTNCARCSITLLQQRHQNSFRWVFRKKIFDQVLSKLFARSHLPTHGRQDTTLLFIWASDQERHQPLLHRSASNIIIPGAWQPLLVSTHWVWLPGHPRPSQVRQWRWSS